MPRKRYIRTPTRAEFALEAFRPFFGERVLDVGAGGGPAVFRKVFGSRYVAVDASSDRDRPDLFADFERAGRTSAFGGSSATHPSSSRNTGSLSPSPG